MEPSQDARRSAFGMLRPLLSLANTPNPCTHTHRHEP